MRPEEEAEDRSKSELPREVTLNAFSLPTKKLGVIAESVRNRTVSGIEERGVQLSQGRNLLFERFGWLDVVAIEANELPADRSDLGEELVAHRFALGVKLRRATSTGIVPRSRSVTSSRVTCCPQMAYRHTGRARRPRSTATSKCGIMLASLEYDLEQILR